MGEAITGAELLNSSYTNQMKLIVNPKIATLACKSNSVSLDTIISNESSIAKTSSVSGSNVQDIVISEIPTDCSEVRFNYFN